MAGCDVKLYALSTCSHCKDTKEYLAECGVGYECVDVDKLKGEERQQVIEEIRNINPNCSFPTIIIGDKVIVGFQKEEIREALNL